MKLFGLGGAAAALPTVPATAAPTLKSIEHPLHKTFLAPLFARVQMKGGKVYVVRADRHPDVQSVRVSFKTHFAGIVERVDIYRETRKMVTIYPSNMNTPFVTTGAHVNIDITGA